MKKVYLLLFLIQSVLFYGYNKKYEATFQLLGESASNQIIQALDSGDIDMICSALKRIGELRLKGAVSRVRDLVTMANPASMQGKTSQAADYKEIYIIGIWTLGRIGGNKEAEILANFFNDSKDKEARFNIINALGELTDSEIALEKLNELTKIISDERLANELLIAIEKHNSKSSIIPLMRMQARNIFSKDFKSKVSSLVLKLSKEGKEEKSTTESTSTSSSNK